MEQTPSCVFSNSPASQEIFRILFNADVRYSLDKITPSTHS